MDNKQQAKSNKNPVGAAILSAMFPGVGLFYVGNKIKAITYIFIMAFLIMMIVEARGNDVIIFSLLLGGFHIYQIFDSFDEAKKSRDRVIVNGEKVINVTLFWAITILAIGVICQLAELDIIRYRDIARLWPIILIGLGAKYIYTYSRSKEGGQNE
ncbi:MAG: hypothetical protein KAT34_11930 [Candidatus Aminicenantes bacterium]|nr:hypothetical protein [Candidatus Aminicenantes bacterium]